MRYLEQQKLKKERDDHCKKVIEICVQILQDKTDNLDHLSVLMSKLMIILNNQRI